MQEAHHFLVNLAMVLCVAAFTTVVFQRLRQPIVLGYLLAGAIVSPHTPLPLFADETTVHAFSELGVILLMFSLGLEFSLAKLLRVAPTAGVVGVMQCSLLLWLGYATGQALGWTRLESLYTGALIAISSTTIIVKAFEEQKVKGRLAEIVFGILIVEDLIAILLIAVLTPISRGAELSPTELAWTMARLAAFLALVVGGGLLAIPRLMRSILRLERVETTVVASVGVCFGFALLADAVGYSVALGSFLAGMLIAESGEGEAVEHAIRPVRDVFAAIFFVSVGMLLDPRLVAEHWPGVVAITLVVVVGKLAGVAVGVFLTGEGVRTAIQSGMSLAQIGEFSFLIAGLGLATGATGAFLYPIAISVSAITTLLTPWLIRASDGVATMVDRRLPAPIQTFASLYGSWLEQLRTRPREPTVGRRVRRLARRLVLDAALLAAVVISASVWGTQLAEVVGTQTQVPAEFAMLAVFALAATLAVPLAIGIARCTSALSLTLAGIALPLPAKGTDLADAPRRALVVALEIAVLLAVGVPLVAATSPFLPHFPGPLLLAGVLGLLGLALWRSARNLHAHARAGAEAIVELLVRQTASPSPAASSHAPDLEDLHRLLPGLGEPVAIRVGHDSLAVGQALHAIRLHELTGATILAIIREGEGVLTPSGDEVLRAGDLVAVAGTTSAIAGATERLGAAAQPD